MNAGLVDEFSIALSPVLFGSGIRLFDGVDVSRVALEPVRAEPSTELLCGILLSPSFALDPFGGAYGSDTATGMMPVAHRVAGALAFRRS